MVRVDGDKVEVEAEGVEKGVVEAMVGIENESECKRR